ncbi:ribonuclease T2 [Gymnopus androsaceus JB14]|uniref:Ribonuclease T2-like n=1 Tax=Gymnopus androsaceus JB14 TaxID=1447944 RepID=A0A6A4GLY2_9AGAR|nr:ribonuclease T2 [Gymnopus androsaceus JB14]
MPNGLAAVILVVIGCTLGLNAVAGSPLTSSNPLGQFDVFARDVAISSGCSTTGTASCHNTSAVSNLCCFESPGGLILQTQFWDTDPSTGPSNSWTIHGLWPDNCDGTFPENCDPSRDQSDITTASLISIMARRSLLQLQFWKNDPDDGSDEELWSHEWDTHGTCYSTLEPSCLPSGSASGTDLSSKLSFEFSRLLPTYTWLENQGITPSSSTTHTLTSLLDALKAEAGVTPMLTCDGSDLDEIAWYFNLKGSLIDGVFLPIDSPESSDCPSSGIKYPLKTGSPVTTTSTTATTGTSTTTTTTTSTSTGAPGALPTKAMVVAIHNGAEVGGLLTLGTWSTQTLGTMTLAGTTSSFTMTSSKAVSAAYVALFVSSRLCSIRLLFMMQVSSGGNLLVESGGSTAFSSSAVPSGETVETVFTGSGKAELYTLAIVAT